jgi:hypothetical protein
MRLLWLTGVGACLAVQGCAPSPDQYYGAPPGYAPQPYAATSGVVESQPPYNDAGYAEPGYSPPAVLSSGPGYYGYATPAPAYGYAPPPLLPPFGFFGRFGGGGRFDHDRFNRDRFGRGRENFERERFERERFEQRVRERDHMRPPPGQPFQGPARPPEFHQPAGGPPGRPPERHSFFEHMRRHP